MDFPAADIIELGQLAFRYAAGVDHCDVALFTGCFIEGARLRSYHPGAEAPFADLAGHHQLAKIPNAMRGQYSATTHMMTNHRVDVVGDTATGEVLCMARHCLLDGSDSLNVVIRYLDKYARVDGRWLIADREIRFLWSERHEVAGDLLGGR